MEKYKFTDESIEFEGRKLFRIVALRDFGVIKCGDLGGFVECFDNLSQYGNAWVCDNAKVFGDAMVCGNAWVYNDATVCGNATVYDDAAVCGNATVCGNAKVYGNAKLCGDATVCCNADYIVFKNWWSSGRYFTWTRSNNMWSVGCFYGTGAELVKKAYADSEKSGIEYERIVNYVENIISK